jgi:hypothetical protein
LPPDPVETARPRRSSIRLALRARLLENPRGNPNPEVIPLPKAWATAHLVDERERYTTTNDLTCI